MGAFLGTEGRKPSAGVSRLPRPGASVPSELRKTMAGVAPAANSPPGLAPAGLSHDDTHVDEKPPASRGLVGKAPLSKPPTSSAPAAKRFGGNAPLPPRAPSVAPPPPLVVPAVPASAAPAPPALPAPAAPAPPVPTLAPDAALPMPASYAPPAMFAAQPALMFGPMSMPAPSTPNAFALASGRSESAEDASGALTYQVFAPESLPPPRPMNLSRMSWPDIAPKPKIAARVGLALVAACITVGTAALIAFGTADEPRASVASASAAANANANAAAAANAYAPNVAAPSPEPPPPTSAAVADPPAPVASAAVGKKRPKAKPASAAGSLGGAAVPPNPFSGGNVGAAPAKAPKKK